MTTHNLGQARRLGDEILFLHEGRLVERAPADRFFSSRDGRSRAHSSKENCHGPETSNRAAAPALAVARRAARGAGEIHHRRLHHLDRAVGAVQHLLPTFEKKTGIQVRVVALGTGQALDLARRGDADVVFVHDAAAEEKFVAEGYGVKRMQVMYNDFVVVGPKKDPAKVAGGKDVLEALKKIEAAQAPFVSRGDKSGTHAAELRYWKAAGIDIAAKKGPGTARRVRAWARRSTPHRR